MDIDWLERTAPHAFEEDEYLDDLRPDGWFPTSTRGAGPFWGDSKPVPIRCRLCQHELTPADNKKGGFTCISCLNKMGVKAENKEEIVKYENHS